MSQARPPWRCPLRLSSDHTAETPVRVDGGLLVDLARLGVERHFQDRTTRRASGQTRTGVPLASDSCAASATRDAATASSGRHSSPSIPRTRSAKAAISAR